MAANTKVCPFCGSISPASRENALFSYFECPCCGSFFLQDFPFNNNAIIKNETASFLFYNKASLKSGEYYYLGNKDKFEEDSRNQCARYVSHDEILAFYPKSFSETIDKILLGYAQKSDYLGKILEFSLEELHSSLFIKRFDQSGNKLSDNELSNQYYLISNYLIDKKYIEFVSFVPEIEDKIKIRILPNAWSRIDEQQRKEHNNMNVFVAMSFANEMKDVREAIKKAIIECGYTPRIMDEIEHNHQIVPEMLYEIRQSRFVIAELTGHNNGAYFEAGYALGKNKEVIQLCREDRFGDDGHFDVKQINTILWKDCDSLTEMLKNRIKATIE